MLEASHHDKVEKCLPFLGAMTAYLMVCSVTSITKSNSMYCNLLNMLHLRFLETEWLNDDFFFAKQVDEEV